MAEEATAATPQPDPDPINVSYGAYNANLLAEGKNIGDIKAYVQTCTDMPGAAQPFVNNRRVNDDYQVQPGDVVTFHRPAGDKG